MKYILPLFVLFSIQLNAQLVLNPGVDTSSIEQREVLNFWTNYIKSKPSKNNTEYLEFWNNSEKEQFKQPDLTLHAINTEHSIFSQGYITVLSISPYKNQYYQIKTAIGWGDSSNHMYMLAITNHYAKKVENQYKLFSPLSVNSDKINKTETSDYLIYTTKNTVLPKDTLEELTKFVQQLKVDFQLKDHKKLTIIYGANKLETESIIGFDFDCMQATNNSVSGMSDISNNLIILNGLSPIFHETTHIYLNPLFTETPLLEGLATFYGGSLGKTLNEGIKFLHQYILENPNIDLYQKLNEQFFNINNNCNGIYIIQGLLVKLAFDKDGIKGIEELLSFGSYEEIFSQYFKIIDTKKIDNFLKTELKNNSL